MKINELFKMAFANLWRRKLRTFLTVLAVVIGATLVALMVSIGSGLQGFIVNQFGLMVPQNTVYISSVQNATVGIGGGMRGARRISNTQQTTIPKPFTAADLQALVAIPGVAKVDYNVNVQALFIQPASSSEMFTVNVNPVPEYMEQIRQLQAGSYFNDDSSGQCILPYEYLSAFGWTDAQSAIGKQVTVEVGKQNAYNTQTRAFTFTVAGVLNSTSAGDAVLISQADGESMARYYQDDPLLYTPQEPGFSLQIEAASPSDVSSIAAAVTALGFSATTPADILASINSTFSVIQIGLAAFGIIALVVAAIGIINTLIMAIYERTREIGVMKAVGATRGTIRALFTVEGGALGLLGGVIGVLLALFFGQALNFIGSRTFLSSYPGFRMSVFSIWLILGVIALTTVISLLAGLGPANRAAGLDPVEALRYE
jgi:putative ABC transport system permease protein